MIKAEIFINDETLDLMELSQMSLVQSFVSEYSIYRKESSRSEWLLVYYTLQSATWNSSGMRS